MRETRSYGSVRGAPGNRRPYRDLGPRRSERRRDCGNLRAGFAAVFQRPPAALDSADDSLR